MDFSTLNKEQHQAVKQTEGPLLVVAGAGSGKTRVLTWRIAYLIQEKGIFPGNILALTFTNKAAKEMNSRVEKLLNRSTAGMWIGTFHAICVRILRRDIKELEGYTSSFVIYDPQDQKTLAKDILKELRIDEDDIPVRRVISEISWAKDRMMGPEKYKSTFPGDYEKEDIAEVYRRYQNRLKSNNAMDFDDLILKTVELLKSNNEVLLSWQDRFKYIHVDEYQDTNRAQYELIRLLAQGHRNLCVVGDLDQSIYGWRGADIRNIRDFEKDFSPATVIKLEQNYRSTQRILEAANAVIDNNTERRKKALWTDNEGGHKIKYYRAASDHSEANYVIRKIQEKKENMGESFENMAILYRTNAQSRVFEGALRQAGIPYKILGGLKFYDRKEIKDVVAYLRFVQNPADQVSLKRVINVPGRHIGEKTIDRLMDEMNKRLETPLTVIHEAIAEKWFPPKTTQGIRAFVSAVEPLIAEWAFLSPVEAIECILDRSGYIESLEIEDTIESRSRVENIGEFISAAKEFETNNEEASIQDFLEEMSLASDQDALGEEEEGVRLMTFHSAKGLEFPIVFMVGMEENLFPTSRSIKEDDLEEERRLCYVGITRAERELHLTHAEERFQFGKKTQNLRSRFIAEVPEGLFEEPIKNKATSHSVKPSWMVPPIVISPSTDNISDVKSTNFKAGVKVRHKFFGDGLIVGVKGEGTKTILTIIFNNKGTKQIMLQDAPLEVIS